MGIGSAAASWSVQQEALLAKKIEEKEVKTQMEKQLGGAAKKKYPGED